MATGVNHQAHAITFVKPFQENLERLHQKRELVRATHRARDINEKGEICRLTITFDLLALQTNLHEAVLGIPRAACNFRVDGKRMLASRLLIVIAEIVNHLLNANRIGIDHPAGFSLLPEVGVRCGINIDGEGRKRSFQGRLKPPLDELTVSIPRHRLTPHRLPGTGAGIRLGYSAKSSARNASNSPSSAIPVTTSETTSNHDLVNVQDGKLISKRLRNGHLDGSDRVISYHCDSNFGIGHLFSFFNWHRPLPFALPGQMMIARHLCTVRFWFLSRERNNRNLLPGDRVIQSPHSQTDDCNCSSGTPVSVA